MEIDVTGGMIGIIGSLEAGARRSPPASPAQSISILRFLAAAILADTYQSGLRTLILRSLGSSSSRFIKGSSISTRGSFKQISIRDRFEVKSRR